MLHGFMNLEIFFWTTLIPFVDYSYQEKFR
jgi:hypothetical protein